MTKMLLISLLTLVTANASAPPQPGTARVAAPGTVLDSWHQPGDGPLPDTWRLKIAGDERGDLRAGPATRRSTNASTAPAYPGDHLPACADRSQERTTDAHP
jgi:hypothetical protein